MALCDILINSLPKYTCTIPSTGESVWFRPLLVKEEKTLLQMSEFGNYKEKTKSISNILKSCFDYDNFEKLSIVDVQYLFIQLRIKSIGSSVSPFFICPETNERIKIKIQLDDIEVINNPIHTNLIELKNVKIKMKYPNISSIMEHNTEASDNNEDLYKLALSCISEIHTPEETIDCSLQSKEELESFLDNMTKDQFDKIILFFETMPKIEKTVEYMTSDGISRTLVLRGISDFFV